MKSRLDSYFVSELDFYICFVDSIFYTFSPCNKVLI